MLLGYLLHSFSIPRIVRSESDLMLSSIILKKYFWIFPTEIGVNLGPYISESRYVPLKSSRVKAHRHMKQVRYK